MATENIGKYQLHLIAYQLPGSGCWEPFLTVSRFDEQAQDFICVLEKHQVANDPFATYEEAIEAARQAGNAFVKAKES